MCDNCKDVFSDATSVCKKYDAKTNAWSDVKSLKKATSLPGVAVYNECLFVVGGSNSGALKDVQKYDRRNEVWELVAPLSSCRCAPCAVANENNVFAIGGLQENGDFLPTAEIYDLDRNAWSETAPMSTPRAFACGVAMETKIFIIGGSTDVLGENALNTCEMYETHTGVWTQIASMHVPRFAAGIAKVLDLKVHMSVGESFNSVESYSMETSEWTMESNMPRAATHMQCSSISIPKSALQSDVRK